MTTPTPEAIEAAVDTFNRHNGGFRESFVAALAAYESAMEAAGWVKVPTEITYLMAFAGDRAMDDHPRGWRVIWSAMIAARPSANLGLLWLWGCIAVGLVMFVIVLCRRETWRK